MGGLVTETLLFLCSFILTRVVLERLRERKGRFSCWNPPPSPPGWPLLGNASVFMGPEMPCEKLQKVARDLGDVVSINIGPMRMLVLSSSRVVREAFVKNADDFSGRPCVYTLSLLSRNGCGIAFADYSASWRKQKRAVAAALRLYLTPRPPAPTSTGDADGTSESNSNNMNLSLVENVIVSETSYTCRRLSTQTDRPVDLTRQLTIALINVVCKLSFGRRYEEDDPELWSFVGANQKLKDIFKPGHPVDVFPFLKVFPWQRLRVISELTQTRDTILQREYNHHLATFDPENIRDFTDALLRHGRDHYESNAPPRETGKPVTSHSYGLTPRVISGDITSANGLINQKRSKSLPGKSNVHSEHDKKMIMDEDEVVMAMWEVFAGGFESTLQTLRWTIAYLIHYPEVQKNLHLELQRVLPAGASPSWSDRLRLPYLEATVVEALRHSSFSSLNGPHRVTRDTQVGGYDVSKDTTVFCNLWWIHHNPEVWKDPWNFNPENFLDESGSLTIPSHFMPFSVGPRVCLGDKLAKMSLFIFLGELVQNFVFEPRSQKTLPDLHPNTVEPIRVIDTYQTVLRSRFQTETANDDDNAEVRFDCARSGRVDRVRETGQ